MRLANTYATLAHAAAVREAAEELGSRLAGVTALIDALRDGAIAGDEGGTLAHGFQARPGAGPPKRQEITSLSTSTDESESIAEVVPLRTSSPPEPARAPSQRRRAAVPAVVGFDERWIKCKPVLGGLIHEYHQAA